MAKIHKIKTSPVYFLAVENGTKKFEIRKNDRDYQVGDLLVLQEYDRFKEEYTGRSIEKGVTYILQGKGIEAGYCILSLKHIPTGVKCEQCLINEPIFDSDTCVDCYAKELHYTHEILNGR